MRSLFLIIALIPIACFAQKINRQNLNKLVVESERSHSEALVIWFNGELYNEYYWVEENQPIECHSVFKSIVSLAIGKLVTDDTPLSIDTPLYQFYPEWKQGQKKLVKIKHLLNHTSGIQNDATDPDEWDHPDIIKQVLSASIISKPGATFLYNNKATFLLHDLIKRISGVGTAKYIEQSLFKPLNISEYEWSLDSVGNVKGLKITATELAKFGQLMLNEGIWNGARIVSEHWIRQSTQISQPYVPTSGNLWWIIPEKTIFVVDDKLLHTFKKAGVPSDILVKFELLKGSYENVNIDEQKLANVFGDNWLEVLNEKLYPYYPSRSRRVYSQKNIGFKAEGWLGQYIVVFPEKNLVGVRTIRQSENFDEQTDEFLDFQNYVYDLVE
ncbi:MAG: serine hydrolase domain-containing protein [Cyclobacteriaceae bacterium]